MLDQCVYNSVLAFQLVTRIHWKSHNMHIHIYITINELKNYIRMTDELKCDSIKVACRLFFNSLIIEVQDCWSKSTMVRP